VNQQERTTEDEWKGLTARLAGLVAGLMDEHDGVLVALNDPGAFVVIRGVDGERVDVEAPARTDLLRVWTRTDANALASSVIRALRDAYGVDDPDELELSVQGPHADVPSTTGGFLQAGAPDGTQAAALAARLSAAPIDDCGGDCGQYHVGHRIHWIQARKSLERPAESATVVEVDGHRVVLRFADGSQRVVWNHRNLEAVLTAGQRVVLRPFGVLVASGLLSVKVVHE